MRLSFTATYLTEGRFSYSKVALCHAAICHNMSLKSHHFGQLADEIWVGKIVQKFKQLHIGGTPVAI